MEQVAAEINPDQDPTMEERRRHATSELVLGQVQNPEPCELPNPRRDGSSQRIGGQEQASELRPPVTRTCASYGRCHSGVWAIASHGWWRGEASAGASPGWWPGIFFLNGDDSAAE